MFQDREDSFEPAIVKKHQADASPNLIFNITDKLFRCLKNGRADL